MSIDKPAPPPDDSSGKPKGDAGKPADNSGRPADNGGKPADNSGRPADNGGKPADDAGGPAGQPDRPGETGRPPGPAADAESARTPMDRWEASQDAIIRDNVAAMRQEVGILESQGNYEAAGSLNQSIATAESFLPPGQETAGAGPGTAAAGPDQPAAAGPDQPAAAATDNAAAAEPTPMERWEANEDAIIRDNIAAMRQEVGILEAQGNYEAAASLNQSIATADSFLAPSQQADSAAGSGPPGHGGDAPGPGHDGSEPAPATPETPETPEPGPTSTADTRLPDTPPREPAAPAEDPGQADTRLLDSPVSGDASARGTAADSAGRPAPDSAGAAVPEKSDIDINQTSTELRNIGDLLQAQGHGWANDLANEWADRLDGDAGLGPDRTMQMRNTADLLRAQGDGWAADLLIQRADQIDARSSPDTPAPDTPAPDTPASGPAASPEAPGPADAPAPGQPPADTRSAAETRLLDTPSPAAATSRGTITDSAASQLPDVRGPSGEIDMGRISTAMHGTADMLQYGRTSWAADSLTQWADEIDTHGDLGPDRTTWMRGTAEQLRAEGSGWAADWVNDWADGIDARRDTL